MYVCMNSLHEYSMNNIFMYMYVCMHVCIVTVYKPSKLTSTLSDLMSLCNLNSLCMKDRAINIFLHTYAMNGSDLAKIIIVF